MPRGKRRLGEKRRLGHDDPASRASYEDWMSHSALGTVVMTADLQHDLDVQPTMAVRIKLISAKCWLILVNPITHQLK